MQSIRPENNQNFNYVVNAQICAINLVFMSALAVPI